MKQVLIYKNDAVKTRVWDVSTPELLEKAQRALFKYLDECEVYANPGYGFRVTLAAARHNCIRAIKEILEGNQMFKFEEWEIIKVEE